MKRLLLLCLVPATPLAAQSFTGEFRVQGIGAYAPSVGRSPGYQEPIGPPAGNGLAGFAGDLSFITGRFRLGPEGSVLRGSERRVWSLGGIARYELGSGNLRPYGLLGGGAYFWDRETLIDLPPEYGGPYPSWGSDASVFAISAGGGMILGVPGSRLAATAEVRFHQSFANDHYKGTRSLVTIGLGGRVAW